MHGEDITAFGFDSKDATRVPTKRGCMFFLYIFRLQVTPRANTKIFSIRLRNLYSSDGTKTKVEFTKLEILRALSLSRSLTVHYKTKHPTVWTITTPSKDLASCYQRPLGVAVSRCILITTTRLNSLVDNSNACYESKEDRRRKEEERKEIVKNDLDDRTVAKIS